MSALVPMRQSKGVATVSKTELAARIADLEIAFPVATARSTDDRRRFMALNMEACAKVDPFAAQVALTSLVFDNPRNPFPPTPQDVLDRCKQAQWAITSAIRKWACSGAWSSDVKMRSNDFGSYFSIGPEPYTADAHIPECFASKVVRDYCAAQLANLEAVSALWLGRLDDFERSGGLSQFPNPARFPPEAKPEGYAAAYAAAVEQLKALKQERADEAERQYRRRLEKYGQPATAEETAAFLQNDGAQKFP